MRTVVASVLCLITLMGTPLRAAEPDSFAVEEDLLLQLRRMGMPGYLRLQLKLMHQNFPGRRNDLQFLNAITRRTRSEKKKLLREIPKTSPRYNEALWELAKATPKPEEKAALLRKLLDHLKDSPGPETEKLREKAGMQLLATLIEDRQEVPEELLGKLVKDKRTRSFWLAKTKLNQADKLHTSDKPADQKKAKKLAQDALKMLTKDSDLLWRPDYWGAMAYVETGRAHLLLGDTKAAVDALGTVYNNGSLTTIEREIRENRGDVVRLSPLAPTYHYLARIRLAEAQKIADPQGKSKERKQLLAQSLRLFYRVEKEYHGHEYEADSIAGFDKVAKILRDEYQAKVHRPKLSSKRMYERGMAYYQKEDWENALPLLSGVAKRNYASKGAAEALFYATACTYKLGRFPDTQAMAELMAKVQPKSKRTHDMLSIAGGKIHAASQAANDAAVQSSYKTGVVRLYERLLELAPDHPQSASAARFLAVNELEKAKALKVKVDKLRASKDNSGQLSKTVREMHAAYVEAKLTYGRLTKTYKHTPQGISAFYTLGYIHSVLGNRAEAADSYLEFTERMRRPTTQKILAKMHAADHLTGLGKHKEADPHWQEILKWVASGAYDRKHEPVERAYRKALARAPLLNHFAGKAMMDRANRLDKEADAMEEQIFLLEQELRQRRGEGPAR